MTSGPSTRADTRGRSSTSSRPSASSSCEQDRHTDIRQTSFSCSCWEGFCQDVRKNDKLDPDEIKKMVDEGEVDDQ